jgi:hypothetical protein
MEPTKLGPVVGSSNRNGATIELCRTLLSPDTRGALRPFSPPKAPPPPSPPGPARESSPMSPDGAAVSGLGPHAHRTGKPPQKRAFSSARGSPRAVRWPATITRSAACGANAWRAPMPPRSRATPAAPRTRRRCDRPPPARCLVSAPGGGRSRTCRALVASLAAARRTWRTRLFAWCSARRMGG